MSSRLHFLAVSTLTLFVLLTARAAAAHCDSLDGPVVASAKLALQKGSVTPVLRWVSPTGEPEVRRAFDLAMRVRSGGDAAKDLADRYFFETLVRIHREGEGAPYTGLKPAGLDFGPALREGDRAVETGSLDGLRTLILEEAGQGLEHRFHRLMDAKEHADESVEAGRRFVAAYTEFMHYAEGLHHAVSGGGVHDE